MSQDEILEGKGGGDLLVYEQELTDTQAESCYQQRFSALIGCENEVIPGGKKRLDIKAADFVREQLAAINWDDICEKQLYATHYGYSVAECLWMRDGANVSLDDTRDGIRVRNRRRFKFAPDRSLRLIVWGDMFQGETMPDRKFWTLRSGADNHDEPYGRGLGHNLYWPIFFKRNDMKFWLRFLEKFSQPTVKVEYPSGMPKDEQDRLLQSAYRMASASALKVPQGTVIDFLEAGRSGTADYVQLWELMDAAISKTILSQTMTTDSGSSLSQAQVHEGVASRLLKRDADLLCHSFNRSVIRWLVDWNYPGAAYPKVWRKIDPAADLKGLADRDKVLFDMGFKLTPEKVLEVYGEGYAYSEPQEPVSSVPAAFSEQSEDPDTVDLYTDRLRKTAGPEIDEWVGQIKGLLDQAGDLPSFSETLLNLYPDLKGDRLRGIMGDAVTAASIAGSLEGDA